MNVGNGDTREAANEADLNRIWQGQLIIDDKKFLKIMHMNIRSIQKNFDQFICLLNNMKDSLPHLIILSETWQVKDVNLYKIPGFMLYYNHANFNQNDGLVVYIKSSIKYSINSLKITEASFSSVNFELCGIKFGLTATYRPPAANVDVFLTDLDNILEQSKESDVYLFVGDININILDGGDPKVNQYLNILGGNGYTSLINKPTRVTENSETCIDHIHMKSKNSLQLNKYPVILQTSITDHYATLVGIELKSDISGQRQKEITKVDFEKLQELLSTQTWETIIEIKNSQEAYREFINKINECIRLATTTIKPNSKNSKLKPWITDGIVKSIRKRDKLRSASLKDPNNLELKEGFTKYRNTLTSVIKDTKNNYYKSIIDNSNNDIKKVWAVVGEVTGRDKNVNHLENTTLVYNNKNLISSNEKTNAFNEYFVNICDKISPSTNNIKEPINKFYENTLFLAPVTEDEIIKYINTLKTSSSPGKDQINNKIIKLNYSCLKNPLKHIINLTFETGIIPHEFKESVVTPIYKSGDVHAIENYRPISLINNFAKIFEKCLKARLVDYLNQNSILSLTQYGFREGLSTEDALYNLINNINSGLEKSKKCVALFLDLRKAFDMVSHEILFRKLESIGIRGIVLELFKNYLNNRKQVVKIGSNYSDNLVIKRGVPQGTVLGPILFLIFINDLEKSVKDGKVITYADDTVLYFEDDTWDRAKDKASQGITCVQKWLNENLLVLNVGKSQFMAFTPTGKTLPNFNEITVHNPACTNSNNCHCSLKIKKADKVKYLGVIVDNHLKWNAHVEHINKIIRKLIFIFYQIRNILKLSLLKIIYSALIESILKYCIVVWGGLYDEHLRVLEVTQKYIIKVMMKKKRSYPSGQLFIESEIFEIRTLYAYSCMVFIHENKQNEKVEHYYNTRTRSNKNLKIPIHRLTCCQRFVNFFGNKMYNMVSQEIRDIKNIKTFKRKLKLFVRQNRNDLKCCIDTSNFA